MKAFFSIIIPTHNDYLNLKRCLKGVLRQNYKLFEIVVVNDCSTDDTKKFLDSLNIKNLNSYHLDNNKGPAYARNIGITKSRGEWICFLDSDDYWMKSKLEVINKYIQTYDNYDVFCHNQIKKENISRKKKKLYLGPFKKNFYKELILNGNCLITSATVVKREFIKKNNIFFRDKKKYFSVEDYDFWLNLARSKAKFKFIKIFLGFYCIHENNITKNILKHKKNYLFLMFNHVFKLQTFEKNKLNLWRKIYCKYLIEIVVIYIFQLKKIRKGIGLFLYSLKKYKLLFLLQLVYFFRLKIINLFKFI